MSRGKSKPRNGLQWEPRPPLYSLCSAKSKIVGARDIDYIRNMVVSVTQYVNNELEAVNREQLTVK